MSLYYCGMRVSLVLAYYIDMFDYIVRIPSVILCLHVNHSLSFSEVCVFKVSTLGAVFIFAIFSTVSV